MARDPFADDDSPDLQAVLDVLNDAECRTIVCHLDEPKSAGQISDECGIPSSTTYRKLEALTDASVLKEMTEVRTDGHHTAKYMVDFEEVRVFLDENRSFDVEVSRPTETADEQLAHLWQEVRKET